MSRTCRPRGAYSLVKRSTVLWSPCFLAFCSRLSISPRSLTLASSTTCTHADDDASQLHRLPAGL